MYPQPHRATLPCNPSGFCNPGAQPATPGATPTGARDLRGPIGCQVGCHRCPPSPHRPASERGSGGMRASYQGIRQPLVGSRRAWPAPSPSASLGARPWVGSPVLVAAVRCQERGRDPRFRTPPGPPQHPARRRPWIRVTRIPRRAESALYARVLQWVPSAVVGCRWPADGGRASCGRRAAVLRLVEVLGPSLRGFRAAGRLQRGPSPRSPGVHGPVGGRHRAQTGRAVPAGRLDDAAWAPLAQLAARLEFLLRHSM